MYRLAGLGRVVGIFGSFRLRLMGRGSRCDPGDRGIRGRLLVMRVIMLNGLVLIAVWVRLMLTMYLLLSRRAGFLLCCRLLIVMFLILGIRRLRRVMVLLSSSSGGLSFRLMDRLVLGT